MKTDIRQLDFNLLKALDALLDERSVTRAAERLSLTQPAVSGMLTRLRDSFGDPLFVRAQRGIVPTPRALELAAPVKRLLADIEHLLQPEAFDPASAALTVHLAATDYALQAVVLPFLAVLRQQAPNIRIAIHPASAQDLLEHLERGDLDLALVTPDSEGPGLHSTALFDEDYVCMLRSGHPDAHGTTLPLERFCALDHVLVSTAGNPFHGVTDEALRQIGRARRVTVSVGSFLAVPQILRDSDLIAVVPRRLALHSEGLAILEPPLRIRGFRKVLAWHERTRHDPGLNWVRALLLETCRQRDPRPPNAREVL